MGLISHFSNNTLYLCNIKFNISVKWKRHNSLTTKNRMLSDLFFFVSYKYTHTQVSSDWIVNETCEQQCHSSDPNNLAIVKKLLYIWKIYEKIEISTTRTLRDDCISWPNFIPAASLWYLSNGTRIIKISLI